MQKLPLKDTSDNNFLDSSNSSLDVTSGSFLSSNKNEKIYFKKIYPIKKDEVSKHLVVIHDFCEFHGRYFELVNFLMNRFQSKLGITLIDLKGHGLSSGTRSHIDSFNEYSDDLKVYFESEPHESIVLGHGLGSLVTLDFVRNYENLASKKISGLILSNPFIGMNEKLPSVLSQFLKKVPKKIWSKVRVPYHVRGGELTADLSKVESYDDDPVVNRFISLSLLVEAFKASNEVIDISYYLQTPVLALIGLQDSFMKLSKVELFFRAMAQSKVDIKRYEMGHDLYNEVNREILFTDVAAWIFSKSGADNH